MHEKKRKLNIRWFKIFLIMKINVLFFINSQIYSYQYISLLENKNFYTEKNKTQKFNKEI